MTTNRDIINRWFDVQEGVKTRLLSPRLSNVIATEDVLYSYGHHFPLVEKAGDLYVLNGDSYSSTTGGHQRGVQAAVAKLESIIIPFSALDLAGVDRSTIRPIVIQEDTTVATEHKTTVWKDVPDDHRYSYIKRVDDPKGDKVRIVREFVQLLQRTEERDVRYREEIDTPSDGFYRWNTYEHLLGESVFVANVLQRDRFSRETLRTGVVFLSGFDHGERHGSHYFLCELPINEFNAGTWSTVAEAYELLKPPMVVQAEKNDVEIVRQGDLFAISTGSQLTPAAFRKTGWEITQRSKDQNGAKVLGTSHAATWVARRGDDVMVQGCLYHDPDGWRDAEHTRKALGDRKTWFTLATNTVPHDQAGRRAWSIASRNGLSVD